MKPTAVIKNLFLFALLTRIIRKELSGSNNKFTEAQLKEHITSLGYSFSENIVNDHLAKDLKKMRVLCTEGRVSQPIIEDELGTLDKLFLLVDSDKVGKTWEEFEEKHLPECLAIPFLKKIIEDFDHYTPQIEIIINKQADHDKKLRHLFSPTIPDTLVNKGDKSAIDTIVRKLEAAVDMRLQQVYIKESEVNGVALSYDEVIMLQLLNDIPFGLHEHVVKLLSNYPEDAISVFLILPPSLIIERLKSKGLLSVNKYGDIKGKNKRGHIDIYPNVDFKPLFAFIADELAKNPISLDRCLSSYYYLKCNSSEVAKELFIKYQSFFKTAGIYTEYAEVLKLIILSEGKSPITATYIWHHWSLAYCYHNLGKVALASETIEKLFKLIKQTYHTDGAFNKAGIQLVIKSFQLAIEVILNYNDRDLLIQEIQGIHLFVFEFLSNKQLTSDVPVEVKCQLCSVIAKYYYKITDTNFAHELMNNAFDSFIINSESATIGFINLTRIEVADPTILPYSLQLVWARTAFYYFKRKKIRPGIAKANLYQAYLRLVNGDFEDLKYLDGYLNYNNRSDGYDLQVLEFLKYILNEIPITSTTAITVSKVRDEIKRLELIQRGIEGKKTRLSLYKLCNFNNRPTEFADVLNDIEIKGFLKSFLPAASKILMNLKSHDAQRLLKGPEETKMLYLTKAITLSAQDYVQFFELPIVMAVLTNWREQGPPEVMFKAFLNYKMIAEIIKIRNTSFKLKYASLLTKNNKFTHARILLDNTIVPPVLMPEFYDKRARLYKGLFLENIGFIEDSKVLMVHYYERCIQSVDYLLKKYNNDAARQDLLNDKARYLNNFGWGILECQQKKLYELAISNFVSSIRVKFDPKMFPYPFEGIVITKALINPKYNPSNFNVFAHSILGQFKLEKDIRSLIVNGMISKKEKPIYSLLVNNS